MNRKELYAKVKELNAADAIKNTFGDNYTRVSNKVLEDFLKGFGKATKEKKTKSKEINTGKSEGGIKNMLIRLLSTFQAKKLLTAGETEELVKLL